MASIMWIGTRPRSKGASGVAAGLGEGLLATLKATECW